MQFFGLGYLVVQIAVRDGVPHLAPAYLGLVGLTRAVPGLGFGLLGGAFADRTDRRRLMIASHLVAAAAAGLLAVLTFAGLVSLWAVLALSAVESTTFAFAAPTRQALLPRLVGPEHLSSAVGLQSVAWDAGAVLGPLFGGLLFPWVGLGGLFLTNAMTYCVFVLALSSMVPVPISRVEDGGIVRAVRSGLRYMRGEPLVRWLLILSLASAVLARPYAQLMPAVAERSLGVGAVELSWLLAAAALGGMGGSFATAALGRLRAKGRVAVLSTFGLGATLVAFAVQRDLWAALVLAMSMGAASLLFMGMANTLLHTATPDELRGRVMSVQTMVYVAFTPLGTGILGLVGGIFGLPFALAAGGSVVVLVAIYAGTRVRHLWDAGYRSAGGRPL